MQFQVGDIVFYNSYSAREVENYPPYIGLVVARVNKSIGRYNPDYRYRMLWSREGRAKMSARERTGEFFVKIGHISDIASDYPFVEVHE